MRRGRSHALLVRVTLAAMAAAAPCVAADWQFAPQAGVLTEYAVNPRLLDGGDAGVAGGFASAGLRMTRRTERSELLLDPTLRIARYPDEPELDNDIYWMKLAYSRFGERGRWGIDAGYLEDSTLTSELDTTGIVQDNVPRRQLTLSASAERGLTERLLLTAALGASDIDYDSGARIGLAGYRYTSASIGLLRSLSETLRGSLLLGAGQLRVDEGLGTRDLSLRVGLEWAISPLWRASISAGPARAESDLAAESGHLAAFEIAREGARHSLSLNASSSLVPTGRSVMTRREEIALRAAHRFTPRLRGAVTARAFRNEDVLEGYAAYFGGGQQLEGQRLELRADWQLSRAFWLAFVGSGLTQKDGPSRYDADGYRFGIDLTWQGNSGS